MAAIGHMLFDTDKEIASIEKATSELRAELERLEGKLRDCRHTRASLAAVEEKEKWRLLGEKQRALYDYNSRTEELNTIREKMDAIEKDRLVVKLLETDSGEVGVKLARTAYSLANKVDTAGLKEVGGPGGEASATSPLNQHPESVCPVPESCRAWHFPAGFDAVRELLKPLGYATEAVALPSIGAEPPTKTLADDSAHTRAAIEKLADAGKKVVVVTHSYGGVVGSCAVEDLGFAQRKAAGKEGGVINFVYLSAFALPKGVSLLDALGGSPLPWMNFKSVHTGRLRDPQYPGRSLLPRHVSLRATEIDRTALTHIRCCLLGQVNTRALALYAMHIIYCEEDKATPLIVQQGITGFIGSSITAFSIKASYSPFLSVPDKLVEGIKLAAKVG
ncbi:hypothetical protein BKA61DRAFT_575104 [Leptodontidium sp. MPI-SDFR-AT-0119]|nr:hypothetical protein BKA61DRAFT_575104 [Leptodontidium sp. MPI-SDFR-AT-0119]